MQNVLEILQKCTAYFSEKGIETPKLDAEILLAHALGCKRLDLFLRFEEPLTEDKLAPFRNMVRRRAKREPLQHIVGNVDFFGLKLKCDARALIPRNETEELCEIATTKLFPDATAKISILDMGTGSGAIALAMANHFKDASVDAVDFSDNAIELAKENAKRNNAEVNIYLSDAFENVKTTDFSAILVNPPIRAGKAVIYKMFEQSIEHLQIGGCLWVVMRKSHGALSAKKKLEEIYGNCEIVNREKGFYILCSKRLDNLTND